LMLCLFSVSMSLVKNSGFGRSAVLFISINAV
jgi:hypothetical protein